MEYFKVASNLDFKDDNFDASEAADIEVVCIMLNDIVFIFLKYSH